MNEKEIEKMRKRFFMEFPVPYVQSGTVLCVTRGNACPYEGNVINVPLIPSTTW